MKNIGIILPNLENNQLATVVTGQINSLVGSASPYNFTIFCEDFYRKHIQVLCPVMNIYLINAFRGLLITTSLNSTAKALKCSNKNKVAYYVWKLEWIHNKNSNFLHNNDILNKVGKNLFTRSESYARAIQNYGNREATILPDIPIVSIYEQSRDLD